MNKPMRCSFCGFTQEEIGRINCGIPTMHVWKKGVICEWCFGGFQDYLKNRLAPPPAKNTTRPVPFGRRLAVLRKFDFKCAMCGSGDNIHIDHIIPRSAGGGNEESNLQVLCRTHNLRKGTKVFARQS